MAEGAVDAAGREAGETAARNQRVAFEIELFGTVDVCFCQRLIPSCDAAFGQQGKDRALGHAITFGEFRRGCPVSVCLEQLLDHGLRQPTFDTPRDSVFRLGWRCPFATALHS
ncbi:hypothetical protein [Nocardia sp. NPDC049149]|uniref:hypothetical protein n=1 Tax=Nocardia sp. NPDC049149 TaxID=3364315 RepID=UPI00371244FA